MSFAFPLFVVYRLSTAFVFHYFTRIHVPSLTISKSTPNIAFLYYIYHCLGRVTYATIEM